MRFELHTCATVTAPPRLIDCHATWTPKPFPVRYGIIDHPREGLILIDTGYSTQLFEASDPQVFVYRNLLRPKLIDDGDPLAVLAGMGARPADVRAVVLTHLHADHCCGLTRFPSARIICSGEALADWRDSPPFNPPGKGFFPSLLPHPEEVNPVPCDSFPVVRLPWDRFGHDLLGDGSLLSVALPGHMLGHMGIAMPKLPQPTLYAADAAWTRAELFEETRPTLLARLIMHDPAEAIRSRAIIANARQRGFIITLCHDVDDS